MKEINLIREELIKKTNGGRSILIETTTQIKSTPKTAQIDPTETYEYYDTTEGPSDEKRSDFYDNGDDSKENDNKSKEKSDKMKHKKEK